VGVIAIVATILAAVSVTTVAFIGAAFDDRQDRRVSQRWNQDDTPRFDRRPNRAAPPSNDTGDRIRDLLSGFELFHTMQHGDMVVSGPDGAPVTKRVARGTVTAVDANSITITCADNVAIAFTIAPTTAASIAGEASQVTAVTAGSKAFVVGTLSGESAVADRITVTK
jgi:hypothetical protein